MQAAAPGRDAPGRWLDTALVALVALLVAAPAIGSPPLLVFDESYYVVDAGEHLELGVASRFQAHPPLGTWLIAAGIEVVEGPVGWRVAALVAGVATVALLHRLAARLLPPTPTGRLLAAVGPLLLVADGSWLVMSRTAMLDGPLTTFVVAAVAAAVAAVAVDEPGHRRAWLVASGAALGAATAVKWSGALAGPVVAVVLLVLGTDPVAPLRRRIRRALPAAAAVAVVALVVYAATWVPWAVTRSDVPLEDCPDVAAPCAVTGGIGGVLDAHASLVRYHRRLRPVDVGETAPAVWPLMQAAYGFFRPGCNVISDPAAAAGGPDPVCDGPLTPGEDVIRFLGNPVVWIGFLAAVPLVSSSARRREPLAVVSLAGWGLQWLPWLAATRTSYIWYMTPTIPFAALALVAAARRLARGGVIRTYAVAALGALVGGALDLVLDTAPAAAIIGWGLAPMLVRSATGPDGAPTATSSRRELAAAGVVLLAAAVTSVSLRPYWVVDPDADLDPPPPSGSADESVG